MKKKFLTVALAATASVLCAFSAFAATEDKEVYSTDEAYQLDGTVGTAKSIDNPLKGIETDKITIEYSLTSSQAAAAWPGLAQFYNESETFGIANIAFWPQIAYNFDGKWSEVSTGMNKIYADTLNDGKPHTYKYVITPTETVITVDGVETKVDTLKGNNAETVTTLEAQSAELFNYLLVAEKFSLGCGSTITWWGELDSTSTVNSFKISVAVDAEEESTTKLSPNGSTKPETGNKPGEEATTKLSPEGSTKPETGDKPGEEATIKPSPEGTKDPEVVKATVVTADAAKAISAAAKVTSKDGKVLDVKLTATPVEDTTVAAGLVNADTALKAAKVKAFAVLDLKLTVDGKNVTLLDEKINVNIPMDKLFADIKADAVVAVYRIDKVNDKEQLSFLGTSKVAADKTITFATEHFSQYVFAVVENAEALKDVKVVEYVKDIDTKATPDMKVADIKVLADASVKPDTNKTGDTTPIMPLVVLAVVALGGVVVAVASKKRA